ncbi:MAG: cell division protein FtsL [Eubacterium sp.]|nr:cell division protein FtsL [Eubacterium sp.]
MAGANSKYVYGSAAEKIKHESPSISNDNSRYYDPYEENAVLKSKKVARNNAKLKKRIVVHIFLIFGMCAIIMFRYAQISQMNYDNNQLSKEYVTLQNENARQSIEILNAMDLNKIRDVAEKRLNMHKPEKSQIVYINVPKQDVTLLAAKEESKVTVVVKYMETNIKKFLNILD